MKKVKIKFDYDDDCRVNVSIELERKHVNNSGCGSGEKRRNRFHKARLISCVMIAFMVNPEGVIQILQMVKDIFDTLAMTV